MTPRGRAAYSATLNIPPQIGSSAKSAALIGAPLLAAAMFVIGPVGTLTTDAWRTAALGIWMAIWWVTEAAPIPATALLPPLGPALPAGERTLRDEAQVVATAFGRDDDVVEVVTAAG